jgi:putative colanic acid biosynthesis glycosyltransferase WcaI
LASSQSGLRVQLWSYNFDPEPTGIGPVSTVWARAMRERGHNVEVIAAHPHYPTAQWGTSIRPYREVRGGIPVLRLPLWVGRRSAAERVRQEASFMASQFAALPVLRRPDVLVSVSPSFPALLPALVNARTRGVPWVLWLHDILPDGASATGLIESGPILDASRWLERTAYRHADRIVVLSEPFGDNLRAKGVPAEKVELIYDPATREPPATPTVNGAKRPGPRILSMGNIGFSQGLAPLVRAFDRSAELAAMDARLIVTGNGVAADEARSMVTTGRVEMLGLVSHERLETELRSATLALVSQQHEGTEFNLPSKLMNFMAYGLPVIAAVNPAGEVARIVEASGGGWVVDSSDAEAFPRAVQEALTDHKELARRARAGFDYAREHFTPHRFGERFDRVLRSVVAARG